VYTELTLIAQYVFQIPTRLHCDIFTPRSAARPRIGRAFALAQACSGVACEPQAAPHLRMCAQGDRHMTRRSGEAPEMLGWAQGCACMKSEA